LHFADAQQIFEAAAKSNKAGRNDLFPATALHGHYLRWLTSRSSPRRAIEGRSRRLSPVRNANDDPADAHAHVGTRERWPSYPEEEESVRGEPSRNSRKRNVLDLEGSHALDREALGIVASDRRPRSMASLEFFVWDLILIALLTLVGTLARSSRSACARSKHGARHESHRCHAAQRSISS
jgi:hypothetical protein